MQDLTRRNLLARLPFVLATGCSTFQLMSENTHFISLTPLAVEHIASVYAVRLVALRQGVALAQSIAAATEETHVATVSFSGLHQASSQSWPPVRSQQLLPGEPRWDAAQTPGGAMSVVMERAGGAVNNLYRLAAREPPAILPVVRVSDDLSCPRFVRRDSSATAITSILDRKQLVVSRPAETGGYAKYQVVRDAAAGLMVRTHNGTLLLYKTTIRGKPRGEVTPPGILRCTLLNEDLLTAGEPVLPFGEQPVYEFDADASGEDVAILASTQAGFSLAVGAVAKTCAFAAAVHQSHASEIESPSLCADPSGIELVFLERRQTANARLLTGHTSVADLRKEAGRNLK